MENAVQLGKYSAARKVACNDRPVDLASIIRALEEQGISCEDAEVRRDGTCPVLRTIDTAIKLFPARHQLDCETELAAYHTLTQAEDLPVPNLLAQGLINDWSYLVLSRAPGHPILEAHLTVGERVRLASELGRTIRRLHELPIIARSGRLNRDWLYDHGRAAVERHREWGTLPPHLIEQIEEYQIMAPGRVLVHADLAVEHVFVWNGELTSIIDWGGAEATDPHYELPILHFDLFRTDKQQLHAFLDGYGWPDDEFVRRAMSATLGQEMDAFELLLAVRPDLVLDRFPTLDALADDLWNI